MSIERIQPGQWNARAVVHNGLAYLSGMVADDKTAPMKEQTAQILAKIDAVLAEIGSDKTKILSSVVYLADMDQKDAMNEALRDWVTNVASTYYLIGTVAGPHPYPEMVRDFQSIIGEEVREQMLEAESRLPDTLVASVGGGSNAIGLFHPFLDDEGVAMVGVEAAGHGIETGKHAASLSAGSPGVLHGNRTYLLQDEDGQINEAHSISAGLDYPGIGPEHSWLKDAGRIDYEPITDTEALEAFQLCSRLEGIIPALEPAHALAHVGKIAPTLPKDHIIVMNMCGRGDKDIFTVAEALEMEI